MRHSTARSGALGFAFVASLAGAQAKADFSGKWMLDRERSVIGGRGNPATELVITQDATMLKVERTTAAGSQSLVYKLDGSESMNPAGRSGQATYRSKLEGNRLVTTITVQGAQSQISQTETLSVSGMTLTIDTSRPDPQGGAPFVSKLVYTKG